MYRLPRRVEVAGGGGDGDGGEGTAKCMPLRGGMACVVVARPFDACAFVGKPHAANSPLLTASTPAASSLADIDSMPSRVSERVASVTRYVWKPSPAESSALLPTQYS